MKFAVLGDTHLGARNASNHYSKFFNKFFSNVFYPYLIENGIKDVIQLGDLFDNRTSLSIKAYNTCKDAWFQPLVDNDIRMTTILGNHDIFYKSTLDVNSPELFLAKDYRDHITVVKEPTIIEFPNTQIALIPWICDSNKEQIHKFFSAAGIGSVDLCMGHFAIDGFEMMRGVPGHGGLPRNLFESFEMTLSGHYHTRSFDEFYRIQYVGTPYEITFADLNDPKGFHIFDTDTRKLTFIENPYRNFERIIYNEGWDGDLPSLAEKSIKLIVEKKTDLYAFDRFVDSVNLMAPHELQIIENFKDLRNIDVDGTFEVEDSSTIIDHYIDNLTTSVDKDRLKQYMRGLHTEAISQ